MERATFHRDVVGTWSTTTRSSRVFERVAEGKRRENSKTSLQKDRWHDDQRMSIHGRRSSVSGAEPSFDTSDYRFSSSSAVFPVHRFARFVSPGATIEIINGTTESRFVQIIDPSTFRCELVYLFFFARKIIVPRNTNRNDVDR